MMCVKWFVLALGLLALSSCTGNVTIPTVGFDHPANPQAAVAPLPPPLTVPESGALSGTQASPHAGMAGMKGMGSVQGMQGMKDMGHGSLMNMEAMDHGSMQNMQSMKGMKGMEGMQATSHGEHGDEHGASAAGLPADEKHVDRTVKVSAFDTMRYKPESLTVKPGETIRFVVTNAGKIRHEFVIDTPGEQREHEEMMKQMANMAHHDANALTLEPGDTESLIWQFGKPGVIKFACHISGHYQAGMIGEVTVGTAGAPNEDQMKINMDGMRGDGAWLDEGHKSWAVT